MKKKWILLILLFIAIVGQACKGENCDYCGGDTYLAYTSTCFYMGGGWVDCCAKKEYNDCQQGPGTGCTSSIRVKSSTGSIYEATEYEANRRCAGSCNIVHKKGVNYTGTTTCIAVYQGCN
jgi:hypothetical protein